MKYLQFAFWAVVVLSLVVFSSCRDDGDTLAPLKLGAMVTVTNTFQSNAMTGGVETAIETLFGQDENALAATATLSESMEFPSYL